MAIVGTAYVATKVISDNLSKDIKDSVEKSLKQAQPALDKAGKDMGDSLGKSMSDGMGKSVEKDLDKKVRPSFKKFTDTTQKDMDRAFFEMGQGISKSILPNINKIETQFKKTARGVLQQGSKLFDGLVLGGAKLRAIGGLIISAAQVASAYVSQLSALMVPLGQSIGAAGGIAATGLSALVAAGATLFLAFKTETPVLERFKEVMASIGDEFFVVGEAIQQELLPGLAVAADQFTETIPMLTEQLSTMGGVIATVAVDISEMVTSAQKMDQLNTIFDSSNVIVADLGAVFQNLLDAFLSISAAAGPLTERFSEYLRLVTEGWAATLNASEATGELTEWFNRAGDVAAQLGAIFSAAFSGLGNVFRAGAGEGQNLLDRMQEAAERFDAWTASIEGQNALEKWFSTGSEIAQEFNALIGDITRMFGRLATQDTGGTLELIQALRDLLPIVEQMAPSMVDLVESLSLMLQAMAEAGGLGLFVTVMGQVFDIITAIIQMPFVGTLASWLIGLLPVFAIFSKLWSVLSFLGPIFSWIGSTLVPMLVSGFTALAAALGISVGWLIAIVAAIVAVIAGIVWLVQNWDLVREKAIEVWQAIQEAISAAWDWVMGVWEGAAEWFAGIWQSITDAVDTAVQWIQDAWNAAVEFIAGVVESILAFFQPLIDFFQKVIPTALGVLRAIWQTIFTVMMLPIRIFVGLVILAWNQMKQKISEAMQAIKNFILPIWENIKTVVSNVVNAIKSTISSVWNSIRSTISNVMSSIRSTISSVWNAIQNTITSVVNSVRNFISSKWSQLKEILAGPIRTAKDIISGVFAGIKGIASGAWSAIKSGASAAASAIRGALNGIIGVANGVIGGINRIITGANKLPGPDLPTIPSIPRLAQGGVVRPLNGGTLALLAEAGRPERVEPLDDAGLSKRDRAMIELLSGSGATEVRVFIGDKELTDLIRVEQYRREDEISRQLVGGRV